MSSHAEDPDIEFLVPTALDFAVPIVPIVPSAHSFWLCKTVDSNFPDMTENEWTEPTESVTSKSSTSNCLSL